MKKRLTLTLTLLLAATDGLAQTPLYSCSDQWNQPSADLYAAYPRGNGEIGIKYLLAHFASHDACVEALIKILSAQGQPPSGPY